GSDSSVAPATNPGSRIDTVTLSSIVCNGTAPTGSAVSRKVHGGSGTFDIALPMVPLTGAVGVECRSGPVVGEYQVVVTFSGAVTMSGASVSSGTGSIASSTVAGPVVTLNLSGVTDVQRLGLTLANVNDGSNIGNVIVPMGVLAGDTSGNAAVNGGDVSQTKVAAQSGTVSAGTFRTDVNANGTINGSDVSLVKAKAGNTLP
ncbi:MAG: dockerin type I domain-containing protein, partial [Chthoniobacterales bacterium]